MLFGLKQLRRRLDELETALRDHVTNLIGGIGHPVENNIPVLVDIRERVVHTEDKVSTLLVRGEADGSSRCRRLDELETTLRDHVTNLVGGIGHPVENNIPSLVDIRERIIHTEDKINTLLIRSEADGFGGSINQRNEPVMYPSEGDKVAEAPTRTNQSSAPSDHVAFVVRQMLSGHSLAAATLSAAQYGRAMPDRNRFVSDYARMVDAARYGDVGSLLRDALIMAGAGRLRAFDVDLSNSQFLGADCQTDPFRWGYEPEVLAVISRFLPATEVFFDIGANWGYFTWHVLLNPEFTGQVVAFEPAAHSFRDLTRIARITGFEHRLRMLDVAVGEHDGIAPISADIWSGHQSLVGSPDAGEIVRVAKLDSLNLPTPALIKLDVENFEAEALRGASRLLASAHPAIVFESWKQKSEDATMAPFEALGKFGYRFFLPRFVPATSPVTALPARVEGTLTLEHFTPCRRAQLDERINVLALYEPPPEPSAGRG